MKRLLSPSVNKNIFREASYPKIFNLKNTDPPKIRGI
jgi:hypothetical protein